MPACPQTRIRGLYRPGLTSCLICWLIACTRAGMWPSGARNAPYDAPAPQCLPNPETPERTHASPSSQMPPSESMRLPGFSRRWKNPAEKAAPAPAIDVDSRRFAAPRRSVPPETRLRRPSTAPSCVRRGSWPPAAAARSRASRLGSQRHIDGRGSGRPRGALAAACSAARGRSAVYARPRGKGPSRWPASRARARASPSGMPLSRPRRPCRAPSASRAPHLPGAAAESRRTRRSRACGHRRATSFR